MIALNNYLKVCEEAVRAGGAEVQNWVGKFAVREKGPSDLVTQADVASQEAIRRVILGAYPDHSLLGEEDDHSKNIEKHTEYRWIADPLDGTMNFVHGLPHYAVSLALEHQGKPLVGAIFNPVNNECFTAAAGRGAWLNGEPIRTSQTTEMSETLAVMGFPPGVKPDSPDFRIFLEAVFCCQGIRRSGSAALNLSYLAAGRYDVFWSYSTKIWDVAAGVLLVQEAGGAVCSPQGTEYHLSNDPLLAAANPELLKQMLVIANKALQKR